MNTSDHYALLLAINHYPGLSNLAGPENDALAFRDWLLDPAGGALDPAHLALIKSSDFPDTTDPYDANPTDTQVKKVLNQWLKDGGKWRDHVGQRLYLFFAGHGFTAGTLTDPALFTAQAQLDDRTHIAGYRYASKIANAGFFDEVVLLMDCCQDVLKASAVLEPSWSPPDRMASAKVKMLVAFGAPRGRKAYEQSPVPAADGAGAPAPPVHGYFSSVFLEALRGAQADAQGYVTARSVEAAFSQMWSDRYLVKTEYEPPFSAPRDMKLYRRAAPAAAAEPATSSVAQKNSGFAAKRAPAAARALPKTRTDFAGAAPMFVTVPVKIDAPDLGAHIRVFDARNRVVAQSIGGLRLSLPQGNYTARVAYGGGGAGARSPVTQLNLRLPARGTEVKLKLPSAELASPIPAAWSRSHHEYQQGPAAQWLARPAQAAPVPGADATLLVFARDSAHAWGKPWRMSAALCQGLRLQRLMPDTGELLPVAVTVQTDPDRAFSAFKIDLQGGTYLLGVKRRLRERWVWDEMALTVSPKGWRTEVWMDCQEDEQDGRRFDLDTASVLVVPRQADSWIDTPQARTTELLRAMLMQRPLAGQGAKSMPKPNIDPDTAGPMATLYAAALLARDNTHELHRVRALAQWLAQHWSGNSADVALLTRWCDVAERGDKARRLPARRLAADVVPMLDLLWGLLKQPRLNTQLAKPAQLAVGLWHTSGEVWVQTQRPEPAANAALRKSGKKVTLPRLAKGGVDLARIASSMGRPDPALSPLHQALRNVLADAWDAGDPVLLKRAVESVARASALDPSVVLDALGDLWQRRSQELVRK